MKTDIQLISLLNWGEVKFLISGITYTYSQVNDFAIHAIKRLKRFPAKALNIVKNNAKEYKKGDGVWIPIKQI